MATRLNDAADRKPGAAYPEGSIGWVVERYKATDRYRDLAPGTLKYYNRYIADVLDLGAALPFAALDRGMVIDFVESYTAKDEPRKVASVLRNLYEEAMYRGVVPANLAARLRLSTSDPRDRYWLPDDISAWMDAAILHPRATTMRIAFSLLLYTAQRPGDVLAMTWPQLQGDTITLRQQKTRKLVEVPCHATLRAALSAARQDGPPTLLIVHHEGRPISYTAFNRAFREISMMAGTTDLQARDLRRTACVRLAEAGATEKQIAAVTGHSIETTRRILETYIPTTAEIARGGIAKWEQAENGKV